MATKRKDKSRVVLKTGEPDEKKICLRKNFR